MDADQDDAAGALPLFFRVGPSSFPERALALRVLFCRNAGRLILILRRALAYKLQQIERWSIYVVKRLSLWVDPRSPHFVLTAVLLGAYLLRRQRLKSAKEVAAYQCRFWTNLMRTALTYEEWAYAAAMVEKHQQADRRKEDELYDEDLIRSKLEDLKQRRLQGDMDEIAFALRADLLRNMGNMCNPELHKGRLQTPGLIQEYINEVRYHLRAVCESDSEDFPREEKLAFVHETRHAFGRTALMLSGGAALGAFHLGVVRTLIEHRLLPRVLSGASVGSIICSFAATRTWTELQSFFDDPMPPMAFFESMGSIFATAHRLLTRGAIQEIGMLQRKMRLLIGDLTFQEAYDLSGRVLNIPVCSVRPNEPHRLLNYLTAPHVVVWSAVTASCAFPGLFEAQELLAKDRHGRIVPYHMPTEGLPEHQGAAQKRRWRDGSLESDLPMKELRELFNVNHFIVAQANPHIAPILRLKEAFRTYGGQWGARLASMIEMEAKHRCQQALALGWRLGGLAKLFAQEWEGDITIIMPATLAQFAKLIQNPTPGELRKAVIQGRRCTWEKLSAIQANCGIEIMLDECVNFLNARRKQQSLLAAKAARQQASCRVHHQHAPALAHGTHDDSCCSGSARHSSSCVPGSLASSGPASKSALLLQQQQNTSWRRIPSWNRFAREKSWGSLEEDAGNGTLGLGMSSLVHGHAPPAQGSMRLNSQGGAQGQGPSQAGPSVAHGGADSDSDSGPEGLYLYEGGGRGALLRSWTKAGGPLMASPSCTCMLQLHDAAVAAGTGEGGAAPLPAVSTATEGAAEASLLALSPRLSSQPHRSSSVGALASAAEKHSAGLRSVGSGDLHHLSGGVHSELHGPSRVRFQDAVPSEAHEQRYPSPGQRRMGPNSGRLAVAPSFSIWTAPRYLLGPLMGPLLGSPRHTAEKEPSPAGQDSVDGYGGAGIEPTGRALDMHGMGDQAQDGGVEDEQGLMFGLAMESSMHGRSTSMFEPHLTYPPPAPPVVAWGHPHPLPAHHATDAATLLSRRGALSLNSFPMPGSLQAVLPSIPPPARSDTLVGPANKPDESGTRVTAETSGDSFKQSQPEVQASKPADHQVPATELSYKSESGFESADASSQSPLEGPGHTTGRLEQEREVGARYEGQQSGAGPASIDLEENSPAALLEHANRVHLQ